MLSSIISGSFVLFCPGTFSSSLLNRFIASCPSLSVILVASARVRSPKHLTSLGPENNIKCSSMQFHRVNNKEPQHSLVVSGLVYARVGIPCAFHSRHSCVCFGRELSVLFGVAAHRPRSFPHPFPPSFLCLFSLMGACFPFLRGGSWLGYQDFPTMGAHSI